MHSSLSCTEWTRGWDECMFLLWISMVLRLLDELLMKRCHLLGLQVIPIGSDRPVTLWHKQNPSWRVKKLENHWWCFLWPATYTLSSNKFYSLSFNIKRLALEFVKSTSDQVVEVIFVGVVCVSLFICISVIWINDIILFWIAVLFWRWLFFLWRSRNRDLRVVWHWGNGWQNVWIYDNRHILPALEGSIMQKKQLLEWSVASLQICGIENFMALFSPLYHHATQVWSFSSSGSVSQCLFFLDSTRLFEQSDGCIIPLHTQSQ